jgi:hypothetical protein
VPGCLCTSGVLFLLTLSDEAGCCGVVICKKKACLCTVTILKSDNLNIVMIHNARIVIITPPGPRGYSSFQTVKRSSGEQAVPYSVFKPAPLLGIK